MSINYYLVPPDVELAYDAPGVIHVAKQSWPNAWILAGHTDSPWGEITSLTDWERALADPRGWVLIDEYGSLADPADLISSVRSTTPAERDRLSAQTSAAIQKLYGDTATSQSRHLRRLHWQDAEGHRFSGADFS